MSIKKVIQVEVQDSQAEKSVEGLTQDFAALNVQVNKLETELSDVGKQQKKNTATTKENTKAINESGGAMGILNSLTGGLATQFKDAYEGTKDMVRGLKGVKLALAATGIGLAVIAIGLLIEHWDDLKGMVDANTIALKEYNNEMMVTDALTEKYATDIELLRKQIEIGQLRGEDVSGLESELIEALQTQENTFADQFRTKQARYDELTKEFTEDVKWWEYLSPTGARVGLDPEQEAELLKLAADMNKIKQAALDAGQAIQELADPTLAEDGDSPAGGGSSSGRQRERVEGVDARLAGVDIQDTSASEARMESDRQEIAAAQYLTEVLDEENQKRADSDWAYANAKMTAYNQVGDAVASSLMMLSSLAKEGSDEQKALALLAIGVKTAQGFMNALVIAQETAAATGPAAAFAFPVFYASQIAAVLGAASQAKSILAGGSSAIGGTAVGSPNYSVVGTTPSTIDGQTDTASAIADANDTPTRAFITSTDVATAAALERQIEANSSI